MAQTRMAGGGATKQEPVQQEEQATFNIDPDKFSLISDLIAQGKLREAEQMLEAPDEPQVDPNAGAIRKDLTPEALQADFLRQDEARRTGGQATLLQRIAQNRADKSQPFDRNQSLVKNKMDDKKLRIFVKQFKVNQNLKSAELFNQIKLVEKKLGGLDDAGKAALLGQMSMLYTNALRTGSFTDPEVTKEMANTIRALNSKATHFTNKAIGGS